MNNDGQMRLNEWHDSKNGKLRIHLWTPTYEDEVVVCALYMGTHDLAPRTKRFHNDAEARTYANQLWAG